MAKLFIQDTTLTAIADAIRSKTSDGANTTQYTPLEMPAAILTIESGGITPEGEIEITENGDYSVAQYASAHVEVPVGVFPAGDLPITENGVHNVTEYVTVTVDIPTGGVEPTGTLLITENGLHDVSSYANAQVTVTGDIQPQTVNISGSYGASACVGALAGAYINTFPTGVTTSSLTSCKQMFYNNTLVENIAFDINGKHNNYLTLQEMFYNCQSLRALPKFNSVKTTCMRHIFAYCYSLTDISGIINDSVDTTETVTGEYQTYGMFMECRSIRKIPTAYLKKLINTGDSYDCVYNELFYSCRNLDEIIGLPVVPYIRYNNSCSGMLNNTNCLRRFTFETNADGSPLTARWNNQTLDFSGGVGYYTTGYSINNSGREDIYIYDAETYAAYKNHKDARTSQEYSFYNRTAAVETLQSLPDTSATGTNIIKFKGAAGEYTDAGAINTMTDAEIAVAAAKGWTVSFA